MARQINWPHRALIHEKDHFAARAFKCGPVACKHCRIESLVVAAHVVRSNEFCGRKGGADLRVQRIKCAGRERLRIYFLKGSARTTLLCFHKNKDGNMAWMLVGPASDLFKTCDRSE